MTCPASPEVNAMIRQVRRLFIKSGWTVHTIRSQGTVSRYVIGKSKHRQIKVRVSDHPPARRHQGRLIISIHPGGQTIGDLVEAINVTGTKKPKAGS